MPLAKIKKEKGGGQSYLELVCAYISSQCAWRGGGGEQLAEFGKLHGEVFFSPSEPFSGPGIPINLLFLFFRDSGAGFRLLDTFFLLRKK